MLHFMQRSLAISFALIFSAVVGCGSSKSREQFTKIKGRVLVDGQPASGVMLTINPVEGQGTLATGISDEQGMLTVSTFDAGDGLRAGDYQVTCQWGEFDMMSRQYKDDRLSGKYSDASKSEILWTVSGEDPTQEVGEILLSTR